MFIFQVNASATKKELTPEQKSEMSRLTQEYQYNMYRANGNKAQMSALTTKYTEDMLNAFWVKTPVAIQSKTALNPEVEFGNAVGSIRADFDLLNKYSNFDDLKTLDEIKVRLVDNWNALNKDVEKKIRNLSDEQKENVRGWVVGRLCEIQETLTPYFAEAISSDGKLVQGRGGVNILENKIENIVLAAKIMFQTELKVNALMQQTTYDDKLSNDVIDLLANLKADPEALKYMVVARYGKDLALLNNAAAQLGVTMGGKDAGEKYVDLISQMANPTKVKTSAYSGLYLNAQGRYNDAYNALIVLKRTVEVPNEAAALSADAFDPFSRIAFFGAVKNEYFAGFTQSEVEMLVRNTAGMPSGLAGLLFMDDKFLSLVKSTPETDGRLAIFSQAATLMSREYINSLPMGKDKNSPIMRKNYEDAAGLLSELDSDVSLQGNQVTDMQSTYVNIGKEGSIALKPLYQDGFRMDTYNQSIPFNNFVSAMSQTRSLIPPLVPQAAMGGAIQSTGIVDNFEYIRRDQLRSFNQSPTGSFLDFSYADNYMERRNSAVNIIGQMNDIYNERHKRMMENWLKHPTSGAASTQLSGSSSPSNIAGDASANVAGGTGQMAGEYYGKTTQTQDEINTQNNLRANASNLGILGQNFYTANVNYWNNKKKTKNPAPDEVSKQVDEHTNAYLESTFPFSPNGTIIGTLVQDRTEGKEETGDYEKKAYYKGDVFVKRGGVWSHYISSKDLDELLDSKTGNGTLRDELSHYFDQTMVTAGNNKMFVLDAAGEYNKATYDKTVSQDGFFRSGEQMGVMLILQPGTKFAAGGVKTTQGDYAALFGYDNMKDGKHGGFLFSGGFFALNPEMMPKITTSGLVYPNGTTYYDPTFRLYGKTPKSSDKKTYITSATWLLVDQYRATVYGGWRTDDNGLVVGEEYRRKNMNVSTVFNFNNDWSVKNGIASVGGRLGRFNFTSIAVKPDDNKEMMASAIATMKIGNEKSATHGKLTLTGSFNQNFFTNGKFEDYTIRNILETADNVVNKYSSISANSMLDYTFRESTMRNFAREASSVVTQGIERGLKDDLTKNQIVNFGMSYKGLINGKPADFSLGVLQLGNSAYGTLAPSEKPNTVVFGMSNFNRVSLIGAYALEKGQDDEFKWIGGGMLRPSSKTKLTLLVTETNKDQIYGTLEWQNKLKNGMFGMTINAGDRLFTSNLFLDKKKFTGIINFGQMYKLKYGQIGTQFANWDSDDRLTSRLTVAAGLIVAPGMKDGIAGIGSKMAIQNNLYVPPISTGDAKDYTREMNVYNLMLEYEKTFGQQKNWYFKATGVGFTTSNGPKLGGPYDFYVGIGIGFRGFNYKTKGGSLGY